MPCPPKPDRPPDTFRIDENAIVHFWLERGHFQARCWSTNFWLDYHPHFPPGSQYNLEIEGLTSSGGHYHYLGAGFDEHIDSDTFIERVMDAIPKLRKDLRLN